MEGGGENVTPFWLQSTTNIRRVDRYRHRLSSLFFSIGILLILLLVTAVFFMVFVLPTTLSYSSAQIFRPNTVKRSWDSVNLVLVIFALLFGFVSRNRNNDDSTSDHQYHRSSSTNVVQKSNPSTPNNEWYDSYNSDQTLVYNNSARSSTTSRVGLMRRNSTSYPDLQLRKDSSTWITGDDQWQFYDDRRVYYRRRSWKEEADKQIIEPYKNIHVDTFVSKVPEEESTNVSPPPSPPPVPSPPPPPPPPPPQRQRHRADTKEKEKRMHASDETRSQTVGSTDHLEPRESFIPLPPPPPPRRIQQQWEQKSSRSDNKKRGGGNGSKDNFLTSFYQKKKKKRQRQRSVDNLDALFHHHSQPPTHSQPPPPPSVFQQLFSSRKGKKRRIPSDPHDLDPPPPPPFIAAGALLNSTTQAQPAAPYKPPLPVKISSVKSVDDNSSSGGSSPLVAMPPPPPPPPFKVRDLKFVVQGDYVSIESEGSSRSQSPDVDEGGDSSTPSAEAASSFFCPSPDVDTKADHFIARFKAQLKLQKINSFNQKQAPRLSNLGRPGLGSIHI